MDMVHNCIIALMIGMSISSIAHGTESNDRNKAPEHLQTMARFLESQPHISYTVHSGYDVLQSDGQKIEFLESRQIAISRPNHHLRAHFVYHDGTEGTIMYDGKELNLYNRSEELHVTTSTIGTIDEVTDLMSDSLGVHMPMAMLISSKLSSNLRDKVQAVDTVGTSSIHGVPCIHLAARGEHVDLQVWIEEGSQPLPRRVVFTYKKEKGMPQYRADLLDWELHSSHDPIRFVVNVPPHAEKHEFKALPAHLENSRETSQHKEQNQ